MKKRQSYRMKQNSATVPMQYRGLRGLVHRFLFGGDDSPRNVFLACGYPQQIEWMQFYGKYLRNGFARRVVDSYPDACWQTYPSITQKDSSGSEPTRFEEQVKILDRKFRIFSELKKVDCLSRIGKYGVLLIGTDGDPNSPIKRGEKLIFLKGFMEGSVAVGPLDYDPTSPRFGLPTSYSLTPSGPSGAPVAAVNVHWSRIIHVSEFLDDDRIYGHSALEPIWNRLLDCEKIMGASGEMFWRSSFPRQIFSADPESRLDPDKIPQLEEKLQDMIYGLKDTLIMQGLHAETVQGSVQDPQGFLDTQLLEISSATGIPKRIFVGTEEGQLAGDQDTENWLSKVESRRRNYCIPYIIQPLIERLQSVGILEHVPFEIRWDSAAERSPTSVADLNEKYISMLSNYQSSGLSSIIPPKEFLMDFLKVPEDKAQAYLDAAGMNAAQDDLLGQEGDNLMQSLKE